MWHLAAKKQVTLMVENSAGDGLNLNNLDWSWRKKDRFLLHIFVSLKHCIKTIHTNSVHVLFLKKNKKQFLSINF